MLRSETEAVDLSGFVDAVWARVDRPAEYAVGALLRSEIEAAVEAREDAWNSFSAAVLRRLDRPVEAGSLELLEARALAALRADVEDEVQARAPQFEEAFKEAVESRIFQAAQAEPNLWERVRGFFADFFTPRGLGWVAAASAAVFLMVALGGRQEARAPVGQVSVERISFEGSVTVMEQEGITVVWLTPEAAS